MIIYKKAVGGFKLNSFRMLLGVLVVTLIVIFDQVTQIYSGTLLNIILMSIICTGGMGLIIWLPLTYVIGTVVYIPVSFFFGKGKLNTVVESQSAIEKYILDAKNSGMSVDDIRARLLDAGWLDPQFSAYLQ